ncbi:porin [Alicycliphilus denitrificans]|uniref:porin n=1 Tax=Alicycliphilus denitrificans TaxID=179636 RepID=UPI00384C61C5
MKHSPSRGIVPRTLKISVAACLAVLACTSHAQSRVTLFGAVDLGVRTVHNDAGTNTGMYSGNNYTSRLGLRGEEDLGGGMKASFWLEGTLNADTGAMPTQFFDRRSTLSLSGRMGEVRLGRDYTPVFRGYATAEVFDFAGAASMTTLYSGTASTVLSRAFKGKTSSNGRTNGSVGYFTPDSFGGFYLNAMVSQSGDGNVSGDFDYRGLRVGYNKGPLHVNAFVGTTDIKPVGDNYRIHGAAVAYKASLAKVTAALVDMRYQDARQTNYTLGMIWPVGAHEVKATWHHIDQAGKAANAASIDANDADLLAIGYVHNLSKRTALYGTLAYLNNKGKAGFSISGATPGAPAGGSSRAAEFGIRHLF